jgi:hypothetical protein
MRFGLRLLPPALLVSVGLTQMAASALVDLTPWKGGGFGMFSTLDHAPFRGVDIVVEAAERSETIQPPGSLELAAARAVSCPADWLLRQLAQGVAARERRHNREVHRVRLTVWSTHFDKTTLSANERTIRSFEYDARP